MVDKSNFYLKIAKNLFDLRKEKKLSIDKFIEIVGLDLDKSTYWGIENNKQNLSLYQFFIISKAFGLSCTDLFKGADEAGSEDLLKNDFEKVNNL